MFGRIIAFCMILLSCGWTHSNVSREYYSVWKRNWLNAETQGRSYGSLMLVAKIDVAAQRGDFLEILLPYCLLRERARLPLNLSSKTIDRAWVNAQGQKFAREFLDSFIQHDPIQTPARKRYLLARLLRDWHNEMVRINVNPEFTLFKLLKRHTYRYICEMLKKPSTLKDETLTADAITALAKEAVRDVLKSEYGQLDPASLKLAKEIQRECGIKEDILYLKGDMPLTGFMDDITYLVMLGVKEDPHARIFALYHEMGHLAHGDLKNSKQTPDLFLKQPAYKNDILMMQFYLEKGKQAVKVLPGALCARLKEHCAQNKTFWIRPQEEYLYTRMLFVRGNEQRADLYSIQKLLAHKNLKALIATVYYFGVSNFVVAHGTQNDHPSHIERALTILGFLVAKSQPVSILIREFEAGYGR